MGYFMGNVQGVYGWPQLPNPIAFANKDVRVMIAQNLYDGPTGMNSAQMFRTRYANSFMITSLAGGHCVHPKLYSVEAWKMLIWFLLSGVEPPDGTIVGDGGTIESTLNLAMRTWLRLSRSRTRASDK